MGQRMFSRCELSPRQWGYAIAIVVVALHSSTVISDDKPATLPEKTPASSSPPVKAPPIICLHTEFLPFKQEEALKYRLMRELGRQAVLIAARDELGLATRDETLDEVFPDSVTKAKLDLFVAVRSQYTGPVRIQLWSASKPEELLPTKKINKHNANAILAQTETLEPMIRVELRDKLRSLGFDGKVAPPNEKNVPPDAVEGQLLDMNFVTQFAAVRAAHAAIAEKGPSRAWLGVLARGYANLSLMTEHHWKSDSEVFAARALLYAQRLVNASANDPLALAQRAYVWTIVGLHGRALEELNRIEELRKKKPDQPPLPGWYELIEPYCSFEREPVTLIGEQRPSLRQLAQRLSFEQCRAFDVERWMFASAQQTMTVCPEDYSVYAALTGAGASLSVGRTGAYYAPAALAHFLPERIAKLDVLPKAVRDAAIGVADKKDQDANEDDKKSKKKDAEPPAAADSPGEYGAVTAPIVESLRATTRSGEDKGEPSWSALGEIVFEEQFVQAANYLNISMNATESSHDDEVKSMLPALKGHRYLRHIESYASTRAGKAASFDSIIGDMPIVDPRGNMRPMLTRLWRTSGGIHGHNSRGSDAAWYAVFDRGITYNAMLEAYNSYGNYWWDNIGASMRKRWAADFHEISPHSPQALRFAIALTEKPAYEQVTQWEAQAGEDPHVHITLGILYAQFEHYDDAIRVYERSIKLSPSQDAFVGLANTYRAAGQENMWQPTLERFFEVETLGLEHASVHSLIANDLIDRGKLEAAEPHALAAAETWSAWGLELASRVEEALGKWDDSEKWIREESTNYPSGSGDEWYFWCRRTGRGKLDDARKLAQAYFSAAWLKTNIGGLLQLFTFHMSENDTRAAYDDLKAAIKLANDAHGADEDMVRAQVQAVLVTRELKEAEASQTALKEARRLSEKLHDKYPHLSSIYNAICDVLDGKPPTAEALASIEKEIEIEPKEIRVNCQYFLGRAYDLAGNRDLADKYWKQCVTRGPFDRYPATLAGKYLCDRNKTSRP
jgi:tetratricopeptide (TPR) repeat protein